VIQPREAPRCSLRLPESLWSRLDKIAKEHGRSRNTEIVEALESHAAREEKKNRK
jgi:predicted transcriptional regulator